MIICDEHKVIELNSKNANILALDKIACYVLVGENPGGTEGDVYVFQFEGNELKVFSGNIFDDNLLKERLTGTLPQVEHFYDSWSFEKRRDGWTQLPFVMGHYVFIRDFMANDISDNWKAVEAKYHFDRLVKGVAMTVRQHEAQMRSISNSGLADVGEAGIKMDDDQKIIVEYLLKYPTAWRDSKGLKAILSDCVPNKKVLRNIMINAFEEGIYEELKSAKDYKIVVYRYKRILCEDYGIGENYADWAIKTWSFISGVDIENAISETISNSEVTNTINPEIETVGIDELELGVRTYNVLKRAGINTVGDLMRLSASEMAEIRNLGRKSLDEILKKMKSLGCDIDPKTEEQYIEQWRKRMSERQKDTNHFSFSAAYDDFISKHKNSGLWDFDDVIIHRKLNRGQYVNTYFCQYDNPPIEIINFSAKREGNKYEMRVGVRNLSKETRNQPIKIRYEIITRRGRNIHDYTDTVTPAPKSQNLVIKFEYDGEEKPVFGIIE